MGAKSDLEKELKGRVFHVTPTHNMLSIEKIGAVLPNLECERESLFGNSVNGYFRLRGCVSFFDYREYGSQAWEEHAYKCTPTQILGRTKSISILFLSENEYKNLVPWIKWKEEEKWSERVVPHVEAGYPGPVNLECFEEHLVVEQVSS